MRACRVRERILVLAADLERAVGDRGEQLVRAPHEFFARRDVVRERRSRCEERPLRVEKVSVKGTAIFPGGDIRDLLALKMPLKVTGIRDLGGPSFEDD